MNFNTLKQVPLTFISQIAKKSMPPLDSLIDIHCAYKCPIFSSKKAKQNEASSLLKSIALHVKLFNKCWSKSFVKKNVLFDMKRGGRVKVHTTHVACIFKKNIPVKTS